MKVGDDGSRLPPNSHAASPAHPTAPAGSSSDARRCRRRARAGLVGDAAAACDSADATGRRRVGPAGSRAWRSQTTLSPVWCSSMVPATLHSRVAP